MIPVSANTANPVIPTATTPRARRPGCRFGSGSKPLDEDRHRRCGQRDRAGHEHEAQGHRQKREVLTVATDDLPEHERRRTDREHDRPQARSRREQRPPDRVGDTESDAGDSPEDVDRGRSSTRELPDDRAHRRLEPERIVLGEEDDPHEDTTERAADDNADAEADRRADREIAEPPPHVPTSSIVLADEYRRRDRSEQGNGRDRRPDFMPRRGRPPCPGCALALP